MTLQELLKKNAIIDAERAAKIAAAKMAEQPAKAEQEAILKEENVDGVAKEGKKENEEATAERSKKKGKKPATREYMVVEDVASVNSEVDV